MALPPASASARWPAASAASTAASPAGVRAPPPSRVAATPPSSDPAPQSPRSGPAPAPWPVATPTSTAPNTMPTAVRAIVRVRMPGAASAPREAPRSSAGRHARDAGSRANAAVPRSRPPAATMSAARVDTTAATPSVSGGPAIQASSESVAWSEMTLRSWPGSATTSGRAARRHAATGGVHTPSTAASPAMTPALVPAGRSAIASNSTAEAPAPATRSPVCPRRSARRPTTGPPTPSAAAYAPDTSPAVATEPVSHAVWTRRAMLSVASGSCASVDVVRRRRAGRFEVIGRMGTC